MEIIWSDLCLKTRRFQRQKLSKFNSWCLSYCYIDAGKQGITKDFYTPRSIGELRWLDISNCIG